MLLHAIGKRGQAAFQDNGFILVIQRKAEHFGWMFSFVVGT